MLNDVAFEVVEQVEVQRRGGPCSRFPLSCLVADLLRPVGAGRVLDITYGEGRWWAVYRPPLLVGIDIRRWPWLVEPDVFIEADSVLLNPGAVLGAAGVPGFDVVAVDPPWSPGQRRRMYSFGLESRLALVGAAWRLAQATRAKYVLLHYWRVLPGPEGWSEERRVMFRPRTRYLNVSRTKSFFQLFRRAE